MLPDIRCTVESGFVVTGVVKAIRDRDRRHPGREMGAHHRYHVEGIGALLIHMSAAEPPREIRKRQIVASKA